ncbi:hypothetical protein [Sphingobium sp. MI1205]|uniref:hypothetical protein n=1 Tax=Sphingobium sp. MI1205 TaxID=407020 RepID=UPI0007704230|nr:hypothetical protein [Sphingobium sp. MI1205]AMK20829.1 hypothetical protein K663_22363 [Sphingobium sp. MI1205]
MSKYPIPEEVLQAQYAAFKKKFGRAPGPHDPLFFDPDADEPTHIGREAILQGLSDPKSGFAISLATLFATDETGLEITPQSYSSRPQHERQAWDTHMTAAILALRYYLRDQGR